MLHKPLFIKSTKDLQKLNRRKSKPIFVNAFSRQLEVLFLVENSHFAINKKTAFMSPEFLKFKKKKANNFIHIYFPWCNKVVKTVKEADFSKLRTNRNKNLITAEEQKKLVDFTVAIAGLSVGGNIATTLVYNGFCHNIKLADFDTLSTTNLNRVRARLSDVGEEKINVVARQIYDVSPYTNIKLFPKGLSNKNVDNFVAGNPKPKLIFEIIDDFEMKILIRKEARKYRVPVVMLTSLEDCVLIDVERYDTEPKTKLFNGLVNETILENILAGKVSEEEEHQYAIDIVSPKNVPEKLMRSIKSINKTLVGRPQLMSTVTVASGLSSFIARKIALDDPLPSGRTLIKFDDLI